MAYYREQKPFRVDYTNFIAVVAQYMILFVFYAGLSISSGDVMNFGLEGIWLGIFLVAVNLIVLVLVLHLGWSRFKEQRSVKVDVFSSANQELENATAFTKAEFAAVCNSIVTTSVSPNHVLAFHYTTSAKAKRARKSGIITDSDSNGVLFSLRGPHQV